MKTILKKDRIVNHSLKKNIFQNPISNFKLLFTKEYDISKLFRRVFHKNVKVVFSSHHQSHQLILSLHLNLKNR